MMSSFDVAVAAAIDVSRPKTSGPSVNVHVVRSPTYSAPDYEKMRDQIQGQEPKKKLVGPDELERSS